MSNYPRYIVLAHLPKNQKDPIFKGEFRLHPTEFQIFDGVLGERQAQSKAETYKKYFLSVQVRTVSAELHLEGVK